MKFFFFCGSVYLISLRITFVNDPQGSSGLCPCGDEDMDARLRFLDQFRNKSEAVSKV